MSKELATCTNCGKEFKYYRSTLRGKDATFCCRKCYLTSDIKAWNKGIIEYKKCKYCGKIIRKWRKYCSFDCYIKDDNVIWHFPDRSGENNPAWKGGVTKINTKDRNKFCKTTGKDVLKRDNYTCQICGSKNELQVDHIQQWSEYCGDRFNIDNCRTLCRSCHYFITFNKPMPEGKKWGFIYLNKNKQV